MEKQYYSLDINKIAEELNTDLNIGLTSEEAQLRMKQYGPNELISTKKVSPFMMFLLQFKDFIVFLLVGATLVSLLFGDYIEAFIIIIIVLLNGLLGFIQEYRAEAALEKLKELTGDDTLVIRNGQETRIDTRNLVPGDVLLMYEGEIIAADGRIYEASRLRVEEGLLTGESIPVDKTIQSIEGEFLPIADRTNFVYMGTTTVKGRGKALVTGTGMNTEMGKIAKSTIESEEQDTPLQVQLSRLGKLLGIIVLVVVGIVLIAQIGRIEENILEVIETAIALAVSAVPEGLAAAITLTLAIGVQRMARKKAVIRKLPAVETLGSVEVICTDKTGTLTQNKMTVKRVWTLDRGLIEVTGTGYIPRGSFIDMEKNERINPGEDKGIYEVLKAGSLCNSASINYNSILGEWVVEGDPTEGALIALAMKANLHSKWDEIYNFQKDGEIFFDSDRKRMTKVYKTLKALKEETWAYTKGSPATILEICTHALIGEKEVPLDNEMRERILKSNSALAGKAIRVLAFARKQISNDLLEFREDNIEKEMTFVGLTGMIDPPREKVADAIRKCKNAGIRIIMITGDQRDTALAIAKELDLKPFEDAHYTVANSSELEKMDDDEFKEILKDLDVCARASPSIKKRIVETLQEEFGLVVAMTGDGVNDAPALKKADIGVAMGITGTDVAREASDMVLMDDNFATIVAAVEEGRTIYDNMKKFIRYLLSSNFDEILVVFTATVLLGLKSPYLALGILWINLMTDGLPALALSVDPGDPEIMNRLPRGRKSGMLTEILIFSIAAGIISFFATMIMFLSFPLDIIGVNAENSVQLQIARTLALTVSVLFELFQVFVSKAPDNKSIFQSNPMNNLYLIGAVGLAFILHLFIIYVKPLADIFGMYALSFQHWIFMFVVVIIGIILLDAIKLLQFKIISRRNSKNRH
ncbi:MAG: cation-translocating P-type ATPase [Candidatus Heimdallarchaeota archaeon]|nr:cation-translocating P-type ATPase [Candidatus Heimdallarchaeota archaeon]